jgi:hypothetical protein
VVVEALHSPLFRTFFVFSFFLRVFNRVFSLFFFLFFFFFNGGIDLVCALLFQRC